MLFPFSPPRRASKKQNFLEVRAIHDGSYNEQRGPGEDGYRPVPPRVAAEEGGGHAHRSEGDQRLACLARHGAGASAALTKRCNSAGLPGIEQDRQADKRYQHAQEKRELFNSHEDI